MPTILELRQALADAEEKLKGLGETLVKAAAEAESDKDEDHVAANEAFDEQKKAVDDLKGKIARMEDAERKSAETAVVRAVPEGTVAKAPVQIRTDADNEAIKAAPVRRLLSDMMVKHHGAGFDPEAWLERSYGETAAAVVKAGQQLTDYSTGGAVVMPDFAGTIISGLENMTVVRRMNPQVLNVPGTLILPTEVDSPNGGWTGENDAVEPGQFKFGDIRLDPKRLPIEAVISRKLLNAANSSQSAVRNLEGYVVRRLREKTAVNEDAGFLRGAGTEHVPLGIRRQIIEAHVKVMTGATPAEIEADLRSLVTMLEVANIMITDGHWVMAPRTRGFLADLRDANGNKIYPSIDAKNTLLGYPIQRTNQIPTNLGGGAETEIMFGNGPSAIIANGSDAEVRLSTEGSYQSGGNHHSLNQRNEMMIHMEMEGDIKLERPTAFSVLTGVTY
ncbi:phage major capsid protein [Nisaea nitritireducens]|uniref:phage major capsid protein n=1 Tax=Nisaea nitritireducens TaxID=568392 RepID=UPI0018669B72|nr:phage major capsid protein [Nisaea nitritireducens]